ncbi:alpha/beta hydrolase [Roseovarius spongiae]|uniref:Alpha/beta hydrolase n=1 Tax=Roseovarius spongiae TaxID=2320272 RepID=A0A3A8AS18_9RHOB|nr:alpha/beta hydrolase [Roseovarius spongiae]RKF13912.1 alpha/beta hydrolase [Roseovarius spongiae]
MEWLAGLLAALALAPFAREALRRPVAARRRAGHSASVAKLPQGVTHYRWRGPEDGAVAVCVHGLTTPGIVWDRIADALAARGYRVLTYDLFGRGLSDRVRGEQDAAFFTRQLADLLDALGVGDDITLFGYSMGGAIAPAFAAAHPEKLRQLVLIAPAGLGHDLGPASRLIANSGLLGNWLMLTVYARSFRRACEAERGLPALAPGVVDAQVGQLRDRGFLPAVLASLRGVLDEPLDDAHRAVAVAGIPVLAIWGETDEVIPIAGKERLAALNSGAVSTVIEGAGHTLPYTHDAAVIAAVDAHLPHASPRT